MPALVVLCTNRHETLDPAVLRRAAIHHKFERPNTEQTEFLLRDAFENVFDDKQYRNLAELMGARQERASFRLYLFRRYTAFHTFPFPRSISRQAGDFRDCSFSPPGNRAYNALWFGRWRNQTMRSGISRSGIRIRGDDYHHLFAWIQVIHAIQGHGEIVALGVEDPEAGNADDVTLYKKNGEREYFQAKGSVDGREPVSTDWLMKASRAGGASVIQGFYKLWASASSDCKPKITLVTNRLPTNGDSILNMRDGRNGTVVRGLKQASARSRAGVARKMLSEHLDITEDETVTFFADIHFILGRLDEEWKQDAKSLMYAAGLRFDEDAVRKGIDNRS